MKLSSATVLFSVSSASALSVNYLDRLNVVAPPAPATNGGGIGSYLDYINSQEEVPALVTALEQTLPPATPAAPAPSSGDYLSALNGSGNAPSLTGAGLTSYLDAMAPNGSLSLSRAGITSYLDTIVPNGSSSAVSPPAAPVAPAPAVDAPLTNDPPAAGDYLDALNTGTRSTSSGASITSYLDTMAPNGFSSLSGAGITSYLDTIVPNGSSSAVSPPAAPAAPAAPAPAVDAPLTNDPPAAGDYLGALNTGTRSTSGAGITSYLDALPPGSRAAGGPGLTGYLEAFHPSERVLEAGPGLTSYVDAIAFDGGVPGAATGSFLESLYSQIMSLPDDGNRKISGNSMAYAKVDGPYALCFVKK